MNPNEPLSWAGDMRGITGDGAVRSDPADGWSRGELRATVYSSDGVLDRTDEELLLMGGGIARLRILMPPLPPWVKRDWILDRHAAHSVPGPVGHPLQVGPYCRRLARC